jgi:holo-[acyl-carrier protein] synthase
LILVGLDAVDIGRFRKVLERRPRLSQRLFSVSEMATVSGRSDPVPGLAARFAAKEAAMKALGTGLGGIRFGDVEVVTESSGAPRLRVSGLAKTRADALGVRAWRVSLTHTSELAAAVVVAVQAPAAG